VFAVIKANPAMYWSVILVATVGNTLGGVVDYWMGYGAKQAFAKERSSKWFGWLERFGAKTMLLGWLPGIVIRFVHWPAGCVCHSGHRCFIWRSANSCAIS